MDTELATELDYNTHLFMGFTIAHRRYDGKLVHCFLTSTGLTCVKGFRLDGDLLFEDFGGQLFG